MQGAALSHPFPPFPRGYRASGLLLHVTSLPSPFGIGDLGPSTSEWLDRLHDAGQHWWQALPVTGLGNSPYDCLSVVCRQWADVQPGLIDRGWPITRAGLPGSILSCRPHERTRPSNGQLEVARTATHAVGERISLAGRLNPSFKPSIPHSVSVMEAAL